MSFWNRFRQFIFSLLTRLGMAMQRFMAGRHGADELSVHLLLLGIFIYLISLFTGSFILSLLPTAIYLYTAFRMLSRNHAARSAENARYLAFFNGTRLKARQARLRFHNRKEYKYFRCPECRAILRLRRGSGTVHVTCGKCRHEFDQKA